MVDGFPELYIYNATSSPASVGEFSSVVATYHSQVCKTFTVSSLATHTIVSVKVSMTDMQCDVYACYPSVWKCQSAMLGNYYHTEQLCYYAIISYHTLITNIFRLLHSSEIKNCSKSTSVIKVAAMKNTEDFHYERKPSRADHQIEAFYYIQR